jgi:hypothetical protein
MKLLNSWVLTLPGESHGNSEAIMRAVDFPSEKCDYAYTCVIIDLSFVCNGGNQLWLI